MDALGWKMACLYFFHEKHDHSVCKDGKSVVPAFFAKQYDNKSLCGSFDVLSESSSDLIDSVSPLHPRCYFREHRSAHTFPAYHRFRQLMVPKWHVKFEATNVFRIETNLLSSSRTSNVLRLSHRFSFCSFCC